MTQLERLTKEWNTCTEELMMEYGSFENFVDVYMNCMTEEEWCLLSE